MLICGPKVDSFFALQYAEKIFINTIKDDQHLHTVAEQLWESVQAKDKKAVYRHIVCFGADVNAIRGQASFCTSSSLTSVISHDEKENA